MSSSRVLLPARRLFVEPGGRSRAGAIPEAVPGKYLAVNATIPGLATCCRISEKDPQRFRRHTDSYTRWVLAAGQWGLGGRRVAKWGLGWWQGGRPGVDEAEVEVQ